MNEKIVIIGAGSAMFTRGIVSDILRSGLNVELALVDIDLESLDVAHKLAAKMIASRGSPVFLKASTDRREVLPHASIVITTIGVGKRKAWEQDVFIPRKYGLYYPVGDTAGPGGSSRALRMIPPMVEIARDVLELAPGALFINYANPMAPICYAVRMATGANMIGLCIGNVETQQYLAQVLGVVPKDLSFSAGGINHMTWFTDIYLNGQNVMPRLKEIASHKLAATKVTLDDVRSGKVAMPSSSSPFEPSFESPFSWQCLSWFDAFPAPGDRHICEFFPQLFREGRYYGKVLGVDEFNFEGVIHIGDEVYAGMRADAASPKPLDASYFDKVEGEQEQVVEIIRSIRENTPRQFFANLPNTGQIPNLPMGVIVETPAVADGRGIHAVMQKPLPAAAVGVLATRYQWVEVITEAALTGNRDKFITALILDGGVHSTDEAVSLADELLAAQQAYLPQFSI